MIKSRHRQSDPEAVPCIQSDEVRLSKSDWIALAGVVIFLLTGAIIYVSVMRADIARIMEGQTYQSKSIAGVHEDVRDLRSLVEAKLFGVGEKHAQHTAPLPLEE